MSNFICKNGKVLNNRFSKFKNLILNNDSVSQKDIESFVNDLLKIEGVDNKNAIISYVSSMLNSTASSIKKFKPEIYAEKQVLIDVIKPQITSPILKATENPTEEQETDDSDSETGAEEVDESASKKVVVTDGEVETEVIEFQASVPSKIDKDTFRKNFLFDSPILQLRLFRQMNAFLFDNLFANISKGEITDVFKVDQNVKDTLAKNQLTVKQISQLETDFKNGNLEKLINTSGTITTLGERYLNYIAANRFDDVIRLFYSNVLVKQDGVYKVSKSVSSIRETFDSEQGAVSILDTGNSLFKLYLHTTPTFTQNAKGEFIKGSDFIKPFEAVQVFAQVKTLIENLDTPEKIKEALEEFINTNENINQVNVAYAIYDRFFKPEGSLYSLVKDDRYKSANFQSVFTSFAHSIMSIGKNSGIYVQNGELSSTDLEGSSDTYTATALAEYILSSADSFTTNDKSSFVDAIFKSRNTVEGRSPIAEQTKEKLPLKTFKEIQTIINQFVKFKEHVESLTKESSNTAILKALTKLTDNQKTETIKFINDLREKDLENDEFKEKLLNKIKENYTVILAQKLKNSGIASDVDSFTNGQPKPTRKNIEGNSEAEYTVNSIMGSIKTFFNNAIEKINQVKSVLFNNVLKQKNIIKGTVKKDGVEQGDVRKGYSSLSAGETAIYNSKHLFFERLIRSNFTDFGLDVMTASDKSTNYGVIFNVTTELKSTGIADLNIKEGNKKLLDVSAKAYVNYYKEIGKQILEDYNTALGTSHNSLSDLSNDLSNRKVNDVRNLFVKSNIPFYEQFHFNPVKDPINDAIQLNPDLIKEIGKSESDYKEEIEKQFKRALETMQKDLGITAGDMVMSSENFNFDGIEEGQKDIELFKRYFYTWAYMSDQFMNITQGNVFQFKGKNIAKRYVDRIKRNVLPGASFYPYMKGLVEGVPDSMKTAVVADPESKMSNILGQNHKHERFDGASLEFEETAILQDNSLGGIFGISGGLHHKSIGHSFDYVRGVMSMLKHAAHRQTNENLRNTIGSTYSVYELKRKAFTQIPINFTVDEEYKKLVGTIYQVDPKTNKVVESELKLGKTYKTLWDLWLDLGGAYSVKETTDGKYALASNTDRKFSYTTYEDAETSSRKLVDIMIENEHRVRKGEVSDSLKTKFIGRYTFKSGMKTGAANVNTVDEVFSQPTQTLSTQSIKDKEAEIEQIEKDRQVEIEEKIDYVKYSKIQETEGDQEWKVEIAKEFNSDVRKGLEGILRVREESLEQTKKNSSERGFKQRSVLEAKENLRIYDEINAKYDAKLKALETTQPTITPNNDGVLKVDGEEIDLNRVDANEIEKKVINEGVDERIENQLKDYDLEYYYNKYGVRPQPETNSTPTKNKSGRVKAGRVNSPKKLEDFTTAILFRIRGGGANYNYSQNTNFGKQIISSKMEESDKLLLLKAYDYVSLAITLDKVKQAYEISVPAEYEQQVKELLGVQTEEAVEQPVSFMEYDYANMGVQLNATKKIEGKTLTIPTQLLNAATFGGFTQRNANNIYEAIAELAKKKILNTGLDVSTVESFKSFISKLLKGKVLNSDFKSFSDQLLENAGVNTNYDHSAIFRTFFSVINSYFTGQAIRIKLPGTEYVVSSNTAEVYDVIMDGESYVMTKPEIDFHNAEGKQVVIENGPRALAQQEFYYKEIMPDGTISERKSARNLPETDLMFILRKWKDREQGVDETTIAQEIEALEQRSGVQFNLQITNPDETYNRGKVIQRNKLEEIFTNTEKYTAIETRPAEIGIGLTQMKSFGIKKDTFLSEIDVNYFINEILTNRKKDIANVIFKDTNTKDNYLTSLLFEEVVDGSLADFMKTGDPNELNNKINNLINSLSESKINALLAKEEKSILERIEYLETVTDEAWKGKKHNTRRDELKAAKTKLGYIQEGTLQFKNDKNEIIKFQNNLRKAIDGKIESIEEFVFEKAELMNASWKEYIKQIGGRIPGQGHQSMMGVKVAYIIHDQKNTIYLPTESKWYKGEDEDIDKEPIFGYQAEDGVINWNSEMDIRERSESWDVAPNFKEATETQIMNWFIYNLNEIMNHPVNMQLRETPMSFDDIKPLAEASPKGQKEGEMHHLNAIDREVSRETNMVGKDVIGVVATALKAFSAITTAYNANRDSPFRLIKDGLGKPFRFLGKEYPLPANVNWNKAKQESLAKLQKELNENTERFENSTIEEILEEFNLQNDAVETLSQLLSASTDNAKELILGKLNVTVETAGMFSYLLTLNVPFKDISDLFTSEQFQFILDNARNNVFKQEMFSSFKSVVEKLANPESDSDKTLKEKFNKLKGGINLVELNNLVKASEGFRKLGEILALNQQLPNNPERMVKFEKRFSEFVREFVPDFNFDTFVDGGAESEAYIKEYEKKKVGYNILFVIKNVPHFNEYLNLYNTARNIYLKFSPKYKLFDTLIDKLVQNNYYKSANSIPDLVMSRLMKFADQVIVDEFLKTKSSIKTFKNAKGEVLSIVSNKKEFKDWIVGEFIEDIRVLHSGEPFVKELSLTQSRRFTNEEEIRPATETTGLTDELIQSIIDMNRKAFDRLIGKKDSQGNDVYEMLRLYNLVVHGDGNSKESLSRFYTNKNSKHEEFTTFQSNVNNTVEEQFEDMLEQFVLINKNSIPNSGVVKKEFKSKKKGETLKLPKYLRDFDEYGGQSVYRLKDKTPVKTSEEYDLEDYYEDIDDLPELYFYSTEESVRAISIDTEVATRNPSKVVKQSTFTTSDFMKLINSENVTITRNGVNFTEVLKGKTLKDVLELIECDGIVTSPF